MIVDNVRIEYLESLRRNKRRGHNTEITINDDGVTIIMLDPQFRVLNKSFGATFREAIDNFVDGWNDERE